MPKSELVTRDCTLAELPAGLHARILAIEGPEVPLLAAHGLHPGAVVTVDDDAPFGGPRIIRLGAARLAIARTVARSVTVRPEARPESAAR